MAKISRMVIEPGKGGFTSTTTPVPPKGKSPYDLGPQMPTIHPNVAHLQAHVGKIFGGANRAATASGGKKGASKKARPAAPPSPMQSQIAKQMMS